MYWFPLSTLTTVELHTAIPNEEATKADKDARLEARVKAAVEIRMAQLQETFFQSLSMEMEGHLISQLAQQPTASGVEMMEEDISSLSLTLQKTYTQMRVLQSQVEELSVRVENKEGIVKTTRKSERETP